MNQSWYKSWALWMSLAALVAYIVKSIWGKDITPWISGLMDVLLPVLVGFGIVNNPNISDAWVAAPHEQPAINDDGQHHGKEDVEDASDE